MLVVFTYRMQAFYTGSFVTKRGLLHVQVGVINLCYVHCAATQPHLLTSVQKDFRQQAQPHRIKGRRFSDIAADMMGCN